MPDLPKTKRCTRCRRVKKASQFWANTLKGGAKTLRGSCRACELFRKRAAKAKDFETLEGFARHVMRTKLMRERCDAKSKGTFGETRFLIDPAWFVSQWKAQRGRCFYTRVPLSREGGPTKVSVERIDSDIGYLPHNCVLVCVAINVMKHRADLPEFVWWCRRVSKYCKVTPRVPTGKKTRFFR